MRLYKLKLPTTGETVGEACEFTGGFVVVHLDKDPLLPVMRTFQTVEIAMLHYSYKKLVWFGFFSESAPRVVIEDSKLTVDDIETAHVECDCEEDPFVRAAKAAKSIVEEREKRMHEAARELLDTPPMHPDAVEKLKKYLAAMEGAAEWKPFVVLEDEEPVGNGGTCKRLHSQGSERGTCKCKTPAECCLLPDEKREP